MFEFLKRKPISERDYFYNGSLKSVRYYHHNLLHRDGSAAVIWYYESGVIMKLEYFIAGKRYNPAGAVIVEYDETGALLREQYDLGDLVSRHVDYNSEGGVEREHYLLDGNLHRQDGPAEIWYNSDGTPKHEQYWFEGRKVDYLRHAVLTDLTVC